MEASLWRQDPWSHTTGRQAATKCNTMIFESQDRPERPQMQLKLQVYLGTVSAVAEIEP